MSGKRITRIYYACPRGADPSEGIQFARKIEPPPGCEFRWLFRHVMEGDTGQLFASITNCDVVVADFSATLTSGSAPDPDVVIEAALARLAPIPRPVVLLHQQSADALPFMWRQLLHVGGIRHVTLSAGPDTSAFYTGKMIGELVSQPPPPPPPPRRWDGTSRNVYVSQSFQRGDGAPGPAGFDFAHFFRAARDASVKVGGDPPVRLAVIRREPDSVEAWYKTQTAISMSAAMVAELTPDGSSGDVPHPDVLTEFVFGHYTYGVPAVLAIQKDFVLPKNLAAFQPLVYDRDDLPGLVEQLTGSIRDTLPQPGQAPQPVAAYTETQSIDLSKMPVEPVVMSTLEPAPPVESAPSSAPAPSGLAALDNVPVLDGADVPSGDGDAGDSDVTTVRRRSSLAGRPARDTRAGRTSDTGLRPTPPVRGPVGNIEQTKLGEFFHALYANDFPAALTAYKAAVEHDPWTLALVNPERFEMLEVLGHGPFGVMFRAVMPASEDQPLPVNVALKVLTRPHWFKADVDQVFFNIDLLTRAPQRGLLPVLGWDRYPRGETEAWWHYWSPWRDDLVPLEKRIASGTLSEKQTRMVAAGVVRGLISASVLRVPHLALRPSNVLVSTDDRLDVSLRDVGFAPDFEKPGFHGDTIWAPTVRRFAAPEQTGDFPGTPGMQSDIYSLGLLMMVCLHGTAEVSPEKLQKIVDPRLRQAIDGCLRYDPRTRWDALEPLLELLHPGEKPVGVRDSSMVGSEDLEALAQTPEEVGETIYFDSFLDNEALSGVAEAAQQAMDEQDLGRLVEGAAVDAPPPPPEPVRRLLDGLVRPEDTAAELFDRSQLVGMDHAPIDLFENPPLPPLEIDLPSWTEGRRKQLICGIDLGTCTSLLSYIDPGTGDLKIIQHDQDSIVTPSVVYFPEPFMAEVGIDARRMTVIEPEYCAQFFKLSMGDTRRSREFHGQKYTPEMLSAMVLRQLVDQAIMELGGEDDFEIRDAVITVPSSWDDSRRESTRRAAEMAGINPVAILSEPVAVSLEVALQELRDGKTVFVYDFGGGTFDVTIFRLEGSTVRLLANAGLPTLGGKDLDEKLLDHVRQLFFDEFGSQNPTDPTSKAEQRWQLLYRCEQVKIALCRKAPPQVIEVASDGLHAKFRISLDDLEYIIQPEIEKTRQFVLSALLDARMRAEEIDHVLLVGGSSQIPMVRRMLAEVFGEERLLGRAVNPQEAVARGACRNALDLWCEAIRREAIPAAALPPSRLEQLSETGVLREETSQALSLIAMDAEDEVRSVEVVVPQGSSWPARGEIHAETARDYQSNVVIQIRFGANPDPEGTTELSTVTFPLRPGTPAGTPLKVGFWYDGPDRLYVSLWDGRSCEVQTRQAPWPGPTPRQVAQWHEVVTETELRIH